jgi:hypothetical protein
MIRLSVVEPTLEPNQTAVLAAAAILALAIILLFYLLGALRQTVLAGR